MNSKRKLLDAIIEQGGVRPEDLGIERTHYYEEGEDWRVYLLRDVSFIWGGVERTLPEGTALGEVFIDFMAGEAAEDVAHMFLEQPDAWAYDVDALEREMLDAE